MVKIGKMISGWWYTYPSEKYEFVSWDYEIPKIWKIKAMFQTTNQKLYIYIYIDIIIYINNKNTIFTIVVFPNISHQPKG